jgi:FkbM family methyltransferase
MARARALLYRGLEGARALARPLKRLPVAGPWLTRLSRYLTLPEQLEPVQITGGIADGLVLELFPSVRSMFSSGEVESEVGEALARHTTPGVVVYDLGANMGYFALSMARRVGPDGRVFAFEPDPEMADRLERNMRLNGIVNVTLVRAAVWNEEGWVTFNRSDPSISPDRGLGRVVPGYDQQGDSISVPAVTLDGFSASATLPGLIKCDVEGAEVEVFEGARTLLERARPVIICEMHALENGTRLINHFQSLGYACSWLDGIHLIADPQG